MLKKYYNRVAHRDEDKKKDAGDKGGDDEFPPVENAFFILQFDISHIRGKNAFDINCLLIVP